MKKTVWACVALAAAAVLSACSSNAVTEPQEIHKGAQQETEISLWTFPVGNWGKLTAVSELITGFHKEYPQIHVNVECLDYNTGDEKIKKAAENGSLPDLVFEGPERLVAGWGDQGLLVDLSDLFIQPVGFAAGRGNL